MEYKERIAPNYYALFFLRRQKASALKSFIMPKPVLTFQVFLNEGVLTKKTNPFSDSNRVDSMNGKGFVFF